MNISTELTYLSDVRSLIETRIQVLGERMETRRHADREMAQQIFDEGLIERDDAQAELANINEEMTQNQQLYAAEYREHTALEKLLDSPYFAGIGFSFDDNPGETERYRIGLMGLSDPDDFTPYIIDWRSPLASVYYEYNRGPASYMSPVGKQTGTLQEKKQIVIRDGKLLRLFDTDEEVQDEILQEILSASASTHMQNIVASLQRDQNRLVRINPKHNLLIQGAAGSGKTSIAMHRAAYMLFRDPTLEARQILLLTPNEQLAAYVSEVLPDLGEENARQQQWIDPLIEELSHREGRMNQLRVSRALPAKLAAASSFELISALLAFEAEDSAVIFRATDIEVGDYVIPADYIRTLYDDNYRNTPPLLRAGQMIDNIRDYVGKYASDRGRNFGAARGEIESELAGMYDDAGLSDLVRRFTAWLVGKPKWRGLYPGLSTTRDGQQQIDEVDISVMAHLKLHYWGMQLDWPVRHLILDEMQDVLPLAHQVLRLLFPCPKTVLGDINQAIHFPLEDDYLEKLAELYRGAAMKLELATLYQAYRSSYEINEFAKSILGLDDVISFERHGEPVRWHRLADSRAADRDEACLTRLGTVIQALGTSGHKSCALICEDELDRLQLEPLLPEATEDGPSWQLLTLSEAKGLEFDAVVIARLGDEARSAMQAVHWYVAATRALHRLDIVGGAEGPDFLLDAASEGRIDIDLIEVGDNR